MHTTQPFIGENYSFYCLDQLGNVENDKIFFQRNDKAHELLGM